MITLELVTEFIREYLRYNDNFECVSFTIIKSNRGKLLDIKVKPQSK